MVKFDFEDRILLLIIIIGALVAWQLTPYISPSSKTKYSTTTFQISLAKGWKKNTEKFDTTKDVFLSPENNTKIYLSIQTKKYYGTPKQYIDDFKKQEDSILFLSANPLIINNATGYVLKYTKNSIFHELITVTKNNKFFLIEFVAPKDTEENYYSDVTHMINSFIIND